MVQSNILYSGTVQGVGFRYSTKRYAKGLKLKGWVRNLPDGRVEILVEGVRETIEELLQHIEQHFDGYISGRKRSYDQAQNLFTDFQSV